MKDFLFLLGATSMNAFFGISALIGYDHLGGQFGSSYVGFLLSVCCLNIILLSMSISRGLIKLDTATLTALSIPVISVVIFLAELLFRGLHSARSEELFFQHLVWSTSGIAAGILIGRLGRMEHVVKWLEALMWIFTGAIINSTIIPSLSGVRVSSFGGATYQTASYIAAFSFGVTMFLILYGHRYPRFKISKTRTYSAVLYVFLFIQILGAILAGGRGAFILMAVYSVFLLVGRLHFRLIHRPRTLLLSILLIIMAVFGAPKLASNPVFESGLSRITKMFIVEDGINWDASSGRDTVYDVVVQAIREQPVVGHGIFSHLDKIGRPHNLFLEVLASGGVIYFWIFIGLAFLLVFRYRKVWRANITSQPIHIFFLYSLTMLMFSGSYLLVPELWFCIAFVIVGPHKGPLQGPSDLKK